jgi:hypothetical protein
MWLPDMLIVTRPSFEVVKDGRIFAWGHESMGMVLLLFKFFKLLGCIIGADVVDFPFLIDLHK